jgi:hypothetical protein
MVCLLLALLLVTTDSGSPAWGTALLLALVLASAAVDNTLRVLMMLLLVTTPLLSLPWTADLRAFAAVPLLAVWMFGGERYRQSRQTNWVSWGLTAAAVLAGVSALWAGRPGLAIQGAVALAALAVAVYVTALRCARREVVVAVFTWSLSLCLLGIVAWALGLSFASESWRVRGLIDNANGTGVLALILFGSSILAGRRAWIVGVLVALPVVYMSGSRSAALAILTTAAVLLGVWLVKSGRRASALILVLVLVLLLAMFVRSGGQDDTTGLFRSYNSRAGIWSGFLDLYRLHPFAGVGWAQAGAAENFYLKSLAELGTIGVVVVVAVAAMLIRRMSFYGIAGLALALGVLVNAGFEGWLLVGGSGYAWSTWLMAAAAENSDPRAHESGRSRLQGPRVRDSGKGTGEWVRPSLRFRNGALTVAPGREGC